jgi:hypothetical protein
LAAVEPGVDLKEPVSGGKVILITLAQRRGAAKIAINKKIPADAF